MNRQVVRVAWYRFRATFGRSRGSYLTLILLIGLLGGLAMASIAGGRRTQSSYPAYLASTNPSQLGGITAVLNPLVGSKTGYNPGLIRAIAHLPHVKRVGNASGLDVLPLGRRGAPIVLAGALPAAGNGLGSDNGYGFNLDRLTVVQGRMADPARADEIVMNAGVARDARLHVGQVIALGIYTNAQTQLPGFGTARVRPYRRIDVRLVGTVVQSSQVIEDDVDNSQSLAYFTPAFTRPLLRCCANYTETGIQVAGGSREVAAVDAAVRAILPRAFPAPIVVSTAVGKAERATKPESIALGVFGGIAALAAIVIAAQVVDRRLRLGADDLGALRALGADPRMIIMDALLGILGAVAIGSLLAVAVAVGLSPLAPIGPVRPVYPTPGVAFDWAVLGLGAAVLAVSLGALSVALAVRAAPHRAAERRHRAGERRSSVARAAASSGLSAPAVAGIRFALEPGAGRNAVPVRSAVLGAMLALIVVIGTVTFGASLDTLVSHPALYGWNWNYILVSGSGGDIPQAKATLLLNHDRYIRAWSGFYTDDLTIGGQVVPVLGESPGAAVQPPILSGQGLSGPDQVVLGPVTLAQLHKHVGDTVTISDGSAGQARLRIVGTATMPTLGGVGPHLEMGTGALLHYQLIPAAARNPFNNPVTGPAGIFVNLRPGANPSASLRSLQRMASQLTNNFNFGVAVLTVLHPAEIVNYRSTGTIPALLGSALGAGAVVGLTLTLIASVRRRRRDLALLKTLGFTRGQLAATIAWQSSVAVAIGAATGVPLGIVLGRVLWDLFANEIHAVPAPSVPAVPVLLIAIGSLVLANVVAAIPGRIAANTPAALALRAE